MVYFSLDLFIEGKDEAIPEVLVQLPPKSEGLSSQDLDVYII